MYKPADSKIFEQQSDKSNNAIKEISEELRLCRCKLQQIYNSDKCRLNIGDSEALPNLSEVDASHNAITSFNCAGFKGILDLRNNKITTLALSNATEGCQATSLFLDGNTLSKTSSVDSHRNGSVSHSSSAVIQKWHLK